MNWDEFRHALTHMSPGEVAARYTLRGVQRVSGFNLFHGLCLTEKSARALPGISGVEYRFVEPERLRQEAGIAGNGLQAGEVESRIDAGEECFGAFIGKVLVSQLWFSSDCAHLKDKVFVHFDPAFAYSRWAFTRVEHRGKHLHALCKQKALEAYAARGRRGILSVVDAWNFSSLKAAAQAGCVRTGWMAMTAKRVWTSEGCRRQGMWLGGGLSAGPGATPRVRV
jgi:hypothetical protein